MAGIGNNLYPPIFKQAYMPAFIREQGCRVYFSISVYNTLAEMYHSGTDYNTADAVQVVVQNQKTNQSVLKESLYPSGIKLTSLGIDATREGNDIYYIEIFNSDIEGGFQYNEFYKVQVRFTSANVISEPPSSAEGIDGWINSNLASFSEWSTVVLIKAISNPTLSLNNFNKDTDLTTFTLNDIIVSGKITFNSEDNEILKSYRVRIYDIQDNVLEDSGQVYTNSYQNPNEIYHYCKYNFESEEQYILGVQIVTQNLFSWPEQQRFNFSVDYVAYTVFEANISAIEDPEAGRIGIHLEDNQVQNLGINIVIRRCSSKENFRVWEDVFTTLIPSNSLLDLIWYDYTVESGVWYKYCAQQINTSGFRSTSIQIPNPVMIISEHIFLTAKDKQLKIKFDPQVSNYSHVISEALNQTLGAQYPFIIRNGNVNYKTFSLSGTITNFMDIRENLMGASKENLYGNSSTLYKNYNLNNNIDLYKDSIYERDFREQVIKFLYENNVKLYKSPTQGNILVKLMNITFEPNNTLSRHIYSFNCTAYEIDEFTYANCVKYNIQDQGAYQYQTNYMFNVCGQIMRPSYNIYYKESGDDYQNRVYSTNQFFGTGELIGTSMNSKYEKLNNDDIQASIDNLSYLKIELTSDPYLIGVNNGIPYPIQNGENSDNVVCLGHIAIINGKYIIIGKDGIYELTGSDTKITSLKFVSANETGSISYEAVINEEEKRSANPKEYSSFFRIGQIWGDFTIEDSIYRKILNKYNQSYSLGNESAINSISMYEQEVQHISGVRVYANPGTVFYLKEKQDTSIERHIIGQTGMLEFYDENTEVQGLYFIGPHLLNSGDRGYPEQDEYIETGLVYNTFEQVENPIRNGVYTIVDTTTEADMSNQSRDAADLGITVQELAHLTQTAAAATPQGLKLSSQFLEWLENSSNIQGLTYKQKNEFVDKIYQTIIKQFINSGNRYIYYQGGWYPFTETNDVAITTVSAIVDYYCEILRKRY